MGGGVFSKKTQIIFNEILKPLFFVKVHNSDYEFSQDSKYVISFLLRLLELPEFRVKNDVMSFLL